MESANVLLVDDDQNFLRVLTHHVKNLGYRAHPTSSPRVALQRLAEEPIDVVVTDLRMPEMDGIELLRRVKEQRPELPVIVLTAYGSIDKAIEATKKGASDFLTKPFEKEELQHAIDQVLKVVQLVDENRRLTEIVEEKFKFEGIVGSSKKFKGVLDLARQLSSVDTTVLIQGESGTGKELIARAIHFNSPRQKQPFVVVNCGAIPHELIETELFGYKKGAFTGAISNRAGKFETAHRGTLFLDEVGELASSMQVKLLRVLQEREIDIVGDPQPRGVDVRIVAATNQDLHQKMTDGEFREDLYYRLSVAPLFLPPLRERKEDIPLLTNHLLGKLKARLGKEAQVDESVIASLQGYDWPGNVRELENILERMVVFSKTGDLTPRDLPTQLNHPTHTLGKVVIQMPEDGFSLEELERDLLVAALERNHWNQTHAAKYLGLTRNTLIYRMQKFDLKQTPNTSERCP